jgi:hypothetical protein
VENSSYRERREGIGRLGIIIFGSRSCRMLAVRWRVEV